MDRNKPSVLNRGQKKIPSHHGGELFPLGSKSSRDETKPKLIPAKNVVSAVSNIERKREAPSTVANASKRLRMNLKEDASVGSGANHYELWEQYAKECDPIELIGSIYSAIDQNDNESIIYLICGILKSVTSSNIRSKVDSIPFLALSYLGKLLPTFFSNELLTTALLSILRRDINIKTRYTSNTHIIATNLLIKGYMEKSYWPEVFLRTYIEDAVNDRFWVDNEYCAPFTKNVSSAFNTIKPPLCQLRCDGTTSSISSTQTHRDINLDDDSGDNSIHGLDSGVHTNVDQMDQLISHCNIQKRFADSVVEKLVVDAIKDQLNKRQQQDNYTKNFLKFLCSSSGIADVRSLCISRLEVWIHNGKLVKLAQQLLAYICFNIKSKLTSDHEVLGVLVRMRLKTKPLINQYMSCLKEIIKMQPDILSIILKLVVQNELSNTRNPNNMGMLATMFQTLPEQSATNLAEIYQEFLLQREDCLRTLRVFLRELVRMLRFDVNIVQFCKVFLTERLDLKMQIEQSEFTERIFHSMVDILCLCMLLSVTPQAREACLTLKTTRDLKNSQVLIKFYNQMSQIQLDAISWMYETVPNQFKIQSTEYSQAVQKLLLLDNAEQYSRSDQWPSEPERASLLKMISETPVHEETLLRIILIGITKDIPFSIAETFDIILLVIKRVSAMKVLNCPAVQANKFDIIDFLFSMSEYHPPENIILPSHYEAPKLAIIIYYWKAWLILLMISAHNPSTFGAFCWDHYPTMKMLMEMCITNQFNNSTSKDDLQMLSVEKEHILQYETYLAANTLPQAVITEDNALLISQLMLMDPMGPARKMPIVVLDQLKFLNETYKMGHMFCRCRKPDLLLDIIQRQGTTQSMPWLSDLVQNSEGDLNHLPVQCLCEFLLFNAHTINEDNGRDGELVEFLRNLIMDCNSVKQTVCEVLDYIFRRLSSTVKQSRKSALAGIKILFKSLNQYENEWLLKSIPLTPHFGDVRPFIIPQLRAACQVENCPELVMSYIQFIAAHTLNDPVNEMLDHVIDMAQLIVERSTMFQHIVISPDATCVSHQDENRIQTLKCLFVMFNNYIIKLREYNEPYEWTEYPDLLMVQFDDGVQLPLHINIIHAFIILLTYSSSNMDESIPILDYWFPPGRPAPIAFLPNLPQEPVQLLPDWLKLKMIRSPVERLIEAALHELTPDQIVLFVQNFGTPVNSMSKLLALLDSAVLEQCDAVRNAILNKAYLAQLIEIQQARGAKNGHYTVQALELHSHSQTVPDLPKFEIQVLEKTHVATYEPKDPQLSTSENCSKEIDDTLQMILKSPQDCTFSNYNHHCIIHQLLMESKSQKSFNSPSTSSSTMIKAIQCVLYAVESDCIPTSRNICSLFRTIINGNQPQKWYDTIERIINEKNGKIEKKSGKRTDNNFENIQFMFKSAKQVQQTQKSRLYDKSLRNKTIINKMLQRITNWHPHCNSEEERLQKQNMLCHNGLFVDWLLEADPEIITIDALSINFLFSRQCSEFRFYLLSSINHQTNWETIVNIAHYLFTQNHLHLDYSTVLNYFEALINNPKLWKGRDKCLSKSTNLPNQIFLLNDFELRPFTEFILREGVAEMKSGISNYDYKLYKRMSLLFRVTGKNKLAMVKFVDYVNENDCSDTLKLQLLQQLYVMYPSIKFHKLHKVDDKIFKLHTLKGCLADKVSNYLITCLGSLVAKKDFETLSSDTELLIRKLGASHPLLFLRQLSVLSSLIQGRAQNTIQALREEYHFHRFVQILRALELLQPMIFKDTYEKELQTTLTCYFNFFKHHSSVKEAYQILVKFVQMLQSYININPSSALLFIEHYVGILIELAAKYTSISTLQQLVQVLALMQHKSISSNELDDDDVKHEFELDESIDLKTPNKSSTTEVESVDLNSNSTHFDIGSRGSISFVISGSYNKSSSSNTSPHFLNLIKIIKQSNAEDVILGPLQEIECLTSKRFSFLHELFDRLLDLIFSPSAQIRSIAFIILIRHLKYNPGHTDINKSTLNAYIQCLRDENSSVAATAIDNLCEMTLLLQEHTIEILSVAFSLGLRSRLNTSTQIKRVLQTMMLQHGY